MFFRPTYPMFGNSSSKAVPAIPLAAPEFPAPEYVLGFTRTPFAMLRPLGHNIGGPYFGGDVYYTSTASTNTLGQTDISPRAQSGQRLLQATSSPYSHIQNRTQSNIYTPFQPGEPLIEHPFQAMKRIPSTPPLRSLLSQFQTYNEDSTQRLPFNATDDLPSEAQRPIPYPANGFQKVSMTFARQWKTVAPTLPGISSNTSPLLPDTYPIGDFLLGNPREERVNNVFMDEEISAGHFRQAWPDALSSNPPPAVFSSSNAHKAGPPIPIHLNGNISPTHITQGMSSSSTSNRFTYPSMRTYNSFISGDMARGQYSAVGEIMPNMPSAAQGVDCDIWCAGEAKRIKNKDFDLASSAGRTNSSEKSFVELPTNWAQQIDQSGLFDQSTHPSTPQGQVLSPSYSHIPNWSSDSELNWALTPRDSPIYPPSSSLPTSSTSSPNSTQAAYGTPTTNAGPAERTSRTKLPTRAAKVPPTSSAQKRKRDEVQKPSSSPLTASTLSSQPEMKKQRVETRKKKTNQRVCSPSSSSSSSSSQPGRGRGRPPAPPRPPPRAPGDYPPIQPRPPGFPSMPTLFLARPSKGKGLLIPRPRAASGTPAQRKVGGVGRKQAKVSRALTPDKHSMDPRALSSSPGIVRVGP